MEKRRFWWIAVIVGVTALLGAWLAIPALAAPFRQANGDGAAPDDYTAMHQACETGDVQGMVDAMDALDEQDWDAMEEHVNDDHHAGTAAHMTNEDWETMEEHTTDDHHGFTGSGMMGSGEVMGTGTGMMGGMMGGQSGQDMMGW